jgi:hypothetical protein
MGAQSAMDEHQYKPLTDGDVNHMKDMMRDAMTGTPSEAPQEHQQVIQEHPGVMQEN